MADSFSTVTPLASTRQFWETRAAALAFRINAAAWLARVAPATFFVASAFAVVVYALRRTELSLGYAWLAFALAWAAAALAAWWRARSGFYRRAEARVLLESQLRLDTRLTAAEQGLVAWPAARAAVPAVVRWQLRAPAGWLGGALALVLVATFAPVPREEHGSRGAGAPPALLQTEAMLAAVKEMNVAEPQAIEQLEERARELARRPGEEQYSHSALEAADALRNQTAVAVTNLARGLDSAADALRAAKDGGDMKEAAGRLAAALSGLRDGMLPANKDLLANLPSAGGGQDLKNLSAEQRAQLAQQLANAAQGLQGISGAAGAGANVARPGANGVEIGPGAGGPGGGGESAPLMLAAQASDAGNGKLEGVSGDSIKRFALGDKLGTTTGQHENDPAKTAAPMSAGAVAAPAAGGEAVWVNRLTPAERAALKNFFK